MPYAALFPSSTVPTGVSGASSFDRILEQCHDLFSKCVSDALTKMLDEADEALAVFGRQSCDPETSKLYEVTWNKVHSQREAIVTQFRMRFLREFQERGNRVKKIGDKFAEVDLSSLEPVAEGDLNESLKFDAMASKLRQYCDEELLALDQRVGVLVGDADLQSEDNPFTPQAIVDAYKQTCRQIDSNVDVRMVLLKLFDDYVLDEIRGVYKGVNALLIENSILPKIRFSVERGKDGAKALSGEPWPVAQWPGNVSGAPVTTNVLRDRRKNTNLGSGRNQMDTMTLDIMAMLFDDLFDDRKIPTAVKGLVGRLQTPMLKLTIADKSFFSRKSHPARRLLDELGEFSAHLPAGIGESDPVYRKLESILQCLIEGFEGDIKVFEDVRQQLGTLIVEMNGRAEQETQPVDRQTNQAEKLAIAKTVARAELTARVRASPAPQLINQFLAQQWVRLLVVVHVKEGEESEIWKSALKTVDLLLWSGKRKETVEERRRMVEVLPTLLKSLADGLAYVGTDDEIRVKFFSDLRKLHALIIGRSAQPSAKAPGEKSVIEVASKEDGTDVASGKPETVEKTEASDTVPDSEAAATIAEPDESETSETAEEPDALPMRGKPVKADTDQEMRLDFLPAERKTAAIPELADMATLKTAIPGEKSPTADSLSATLRQEQEAVAAKPVAQNAVPDDAGPIADSLPPLEFEVETEKPCEQNAVPDDAGPIADSLPPLEFEAETEKPCEQDAVPVDIESIVNSLPSLELKAETEKPCEHGAAPADTASDAQPLPPEQRAGLPSAEAEADEAADRVRSEEPEPTKSTARTHEEPPTELRAEMDQALEATRTMFSDIDRFIILGQIRNATNLLEVRIKRNPTDRDSWIKLMAIYRDEGMDGGFHRTYAAFCEQFGNSPSS